MQKIKLFSCILFLLFIPLKVNAADQYTFPQTVEELYQWVRDTFGDFTISEEPPPDLSTINAQVVDQHGNPVTDGEVVITWSYTDITDFKKKVKEVVVKTDSEGEFQAKSTTLKPPSINKITKKGYEYTFDMNPFFQLPVKEREAKILASTNIPIKFYMRKMGKTTFLLKNNYSWYVKEPENFISYNMFVREHSKVDRDLSKLENPNLIDLVFDVTKSESSYSLRFIAPTETGGVQASDQMLYEAPADGYTPELTLSFQAGDEMTKYLYFKSRNPVVYSRMTMEFRASIEKLAFHYSNATNPYGFRNLEYEPDLPFSFEDKLEREAEEALKNGKLAPEPNL